MYALIIVDYNSIDKTIKYIHDFLAQSKDVNSIHPIIIDNSPKNSEGYVKQYYEGTFYEVYVNGKRVLVIEMPEGTKIIYCYSGENLGYAKANNLGSEIADILFDDPFYIISNNDLKLVEPFDGNTFESIFYKDPEIAVIGPKIIGIDGKRQSPHKKVGAFKLLIAYYWFNRWPFRWKPDYDYTDTSKICYRVMGSFMIIKAVPFRLAGRFDPNTFMFAEEMILSERLNSIGYKMYYYNDYTIVHEHGASVKKVSSVIKSEQWSFDSCCYYFERYRKTGCGIIKIAKLNFKIYKCILYLKNWLKKIYMKVK